MKHDLGFPNSHFKYISHKSERIIIEMQIASKMDELVFVFEIKFCVNENLTCERTRSHTHEVARAA